MGRFIQCLTASVLLGRVLAVQFDTGPSCLDIDEFAPVPTDPSYWPEAAGPDPASDYLRLKDVCMNSLYEGKGPNPPPNYDCCPNGEKRLSKCRVPPQWAWSRDHNGEKMIALCEKRCWCKKAQTDVNYMLRRIRNPEVDNLKSRLLDMWDGLSASDIEVPEPPPVEDNTAWNQVVVDSLASTYAMLCPPPDPCTAQQDCAGPSNAVASAAPAASGSAQGSCSTQGECDAVPFVAGDRPPLSSGASSSSSTSTNAFCNNNRMCAAVPQPRRPGPLSAANVAHYLIAGVTVGRRARIVGRCVPKAPFNHFLGKRDFVGPSCYCNATFVHQECCNAPNGLLWGVENQGMRI
ncbi:MAG: hypothetical protein M1814_002720 [Vezdaea aestivalis]|nr:MAG: hypothetical protein M1814_002720 [Vezdaea aestivalis]